MAGRDLLERFLKTKGISVLKPEVTGVNTITGSNIEDVQLFYRLLKDLIVKIN